MTRLRRLLVFALPLFLLPAAIRPETISGKVTDFDSQAPLAGVKISLSPSLWALTGEDGAYTLNTEANAARDRKRPARTHARTGRLRFPDGLLSRDPGSRYVTFELRNLQGAWMGHSPLDPGIGQDGISGETESFPRPTLAKTAAIHRLTFEKSGYMNAVQQINGSQAGVDMRLKRGSLAARKAQLTWYTSYPDPNSEECLQYNGCTWAGQFAALNGVQPESWVKANNIVAVHSQDFSQYKLKTLRLTSGYRQIDAKVYDMCSDADCDGCCTRNAQPSGFLIDMESYTAQRFGQNDGQIDWVCLDCD